MWLPIRCAASWSAEIPALMSAPSVLRGMAQARAAVADGRATATLEAMVG